MQIIRFLEHEGELYKVGERVGVTYYNDYYTRKEQLCILVQCLIAKLGFLRIV